MNTIILGAVSGSDIVQQLLYVLVIGICVAIVWWLGKLAITKFGMHPTVLIVWNGLFILLGALCVINFLLSLIDKPLVRW